MKSNTQSDVATLLAPWNGPYGGLPSFTGISSAAIEDAMRAAIELKRVEVQTIASVSEPPTFQNTAEAFENCGRALQRVKCVFHVYANSLSLGDMPAVAQRLVAHIAALMMRLHTTKTCTRGSTLFGTVVINLAYRPSSKDWWRCC